MWRQQSGVCVCGGQGWWVGRLRGREAVEVTCMKHNEMRHWEAENGGRSEACLPPPGAWQSWTPRWWHIHQRPRLQGPGCGLVDSKQGQGMGMTRWGAGNTEADTPCGRSTGDGKEGKVHIDTSLRGWGAVLRGLRTCLPDSRGKAKSTLPVHTEAKERPLSLAALSRGLGRLYFSLYLTLAGPLISLLSIFLSPQ